MAEITYLVACLDCGNSNFAIIKSFSTPEARADWMKQHKNRKYHTHRWVADWPDYPGGARHG